MRSLKRYKRKWIVFGCMLSVFSLWFLVGILRVPVGTQAKITTPLAKPSNSMVHVEYPSVDFKFVFPEISPHVNVDTKQNIFMMVLVNSASKGELFRNRREAIRQTWGSQRNCEQRKALRDEKLKDLRWLLVFLVGKAGPGTNDDELNMAEAMQRNDMLIGNITDNYTNNVIKKFMGLVWASKFDIKYIMKTDDDVYVRIPRVVEYLVNASFPKPFYGGMTMEARIVNRGFKRKWPVSWEDYGELKFPRFNSGAFYIFSSDLLNRLFNYVYVRKPFHADDAYVGVAMRDLGVRPTKILTFFVVPNINKFVRLAKDCQVLTNDGFGHHMRPDSNALLQERLKSLACGNAKIQC